MKFKLPRKATAPFCPSAVEHSIVIPANASKWRKLWLFLGPGLLISIGYMDPGNWATSIEAGSKFGYGLLMVVLLASLTGMFIQNLCAQLGIATGQDLAQLCQQHYSKVVGRILWVLAELSIIATDLAEVLGCALAFHLLFDIPLILGVVLTIFDTFLVLALQGKNFRRIEAIIVSLIATICLCFIIELYLIPPNWQQVATHATPALSTIMQKDYVYLAIAIFGATVMPHNLYLHSSIVQTRQFGKSISERKTALFYARLDTFISLSIALLVNAAILMLAAAAFHEHGQRHINDLADAYRLLEPLIGSSLAPLLFGLALLAAGQSSTFTGTIAGQVVMDGFLQKRIPCWQRRIISRSIALLPACLGIWLLGDNAVTQLLVFSQVVLCLQLPFVLWPLIRFCRDKKLMGDFVIGRTHQTIAWSIFAIISIANLFLILG